MKKQLLKLFNFRSRPRNTTLYTLMLVFLSGIGYAQGEKITLSDNAYTVEDIIKEIETQSKFSVAVSEQQVDLTLVVTGVSDNETVKSLLEKVTRVGGLRAEIVKNTIIIRKPNSIKQAGVIDNGARTIHGFINDQNGEGLPGANVKVQNRPSGTTTSNTGYFELRVREDVDSIIVSFIGFQNKTIAIEGRNSITTILAEDNEVLEEAVVVGYGKQSKAKVTGSITGIKAEDIEDLPVTSFDQALVGKTPGVQIIQNSGAPGSSTSIRIRGLSTLTAGSSPLIVLDGLPLEDNNTSDINPNDIASVEVLKDAAAAAIYGSRGGNGVILITTKKGGVPDKTVYNFNSYIGFQEVSHKVDLMDAYELSELMAQARNNQWVRLDPANNKPSDPNNIRTDGSSEIPPMIFPYLEGESGLTDTDWQDEIFRKAMMQNYQLSVSGNSDKISYYISGNYLDQDGIIVGSGMQRFSLRSNTELKLNRKLKIGINLSPSIANYSLISEKTYKKDGVVLSALMALPMLPAYNEDGSYAISGHIENGNYNTVWLENPIALATEIDDEMERFRMLGWAYLDYQIVQALKYRFYLGVEYGTYRENYYRPSTLGTYRLAAPSIPIATSSTDRLSNWTMEHTLNYDKSLGGGHSVDILGGFSMQKGNHEQSYVSATNFPNDELKTVNGGQVTGGSSSISEWGLISLISRIQYDYEAKYLLSVSLRGDASSRFGEDSRWGYFPSVSAGWRISEEPFYNIKNTINEAKIKVSYGQTGNNQIGNYSSYALLQTSNYPVGSGVNTGLANSTSPNSNLSWEKTNMTNIGLDLYFWNNKLHFLAEAYNATTDGLLLNVPVPATSGYQSSLQNIGKISNRGIELSLGTNVKIGAVQWEAAVNFSSNRNEVLELGPGQERIIDEFHITQIGSPIGSFYGYRTDGVFVSQEDLDAYPHLSTSEVGSYKYEDVNGDGQISDADRTILGDFFPDYTYGFENTFRWKNIDLNFLIQGAQNFQVYNLTKAFTSSTQGWSNGEQEVYDGYYRSESSPGDGYSKPLTKPLDKLHEQSDLMLEDASYIRLRNVVLGYNFKTSNRLSQLGVNSLRLYLSLKNLVTLTSYTGYNPEVSSYGTNALTPGIDYGAYPVEKSYVMGVTLTF